MQPQNLGLDLERFAALRKSIPDWQLWVEADRIMRQEGLTMEDVLNG